MVTEIARDRITTAPRRRQRRDDFQHDVLFELQDEVVKLFRSASAADVEALRLYDEATSDEHARGEAEATPLWRENRQQFRDAAHRIEALVVRVDDEQLRRDSARLLEHGPAFAVDPPAWFRMRGPGDPDVLREMDEVRRQLNRRIGRMPRGDDPSPPSSPLRRWERRAARAIGRGRG